MSSIYLSEHSVGSSVRCAAQLYSRHFATISLIALPIVPLLWVSAELYAVAKWWTTALAFLVDLLLFNLFTGPMTYAVSLICLGRSPKAAEVYKSFDFRRSVHLAKLNLRMAVYGLLVLPLFPALVWSGLAPSVIVLEQKDVREAIARSKQLARGAKLRLVCAWILPLILGMELMVMIERLAPFAFKLMPEAPLLAPWLQAASSFVRLLVIVPANIIPVLLYYDRRVSKEGYDLVALAEDLSR